MRRPILVWKVLRHARRFLQAMIVNHSDDFCVPGSAPAPEMLAEGKQIMNRLKLSVNADRARCLRCRRSR